MFTHHFSPLQCNHKIHGKPIHQKPAKATESRETIKLCETDMTRHLIIPSRDPVDLPGIFPKTEIQRLKNQAHVRIRTNIHYKLLFKIPLQIVTTKDRIAMIDEANKKKLEALEESEKRKEMLRKSLVQQKAPGSKLHRVGSDCEAMLKFLFLCFVAD